ncbi:MAG: YacP-like domain [Pseudomonadota bacterium]|jgi:hypothetical protein
MTRLAEAMQPLRVFIDGHNLLFRLGALYGPEGREPLKQDLEALLMRWPSASARLWFDAEESQEIEVHDRFQVSYAGGKGRDKADKAILQTLWDERLESRPPTFVVSDDRGVWRRALGLRGIRVSCYEFRCVLRMEGPGTEAEHH